MPFRSVARASISQADIVFRPDNLNNPEEQRVPTEEYEGELYPVETQMPQSENGGKDRDKGGPLSITLYALLLLSIAGLVFAVTKYMQVPRNTLPLLSSQDEDTTSGVVASNGLGTVAAAVPDQDPDAYRSDIEYIVSTEIDDDCSTNFLEGAQKMAIDWLVYEDNVLTSTKIRAMVESMDSNTIGSGDLVPNFPLVQRYAMMVLFFGTSGELWSDASWSEMVDIPECMFMGVDCDLEGQAVVLDLSFRKLRGRLPEEVGMLTKLESLSFLSNSLEGTIPSFIYNKLTNLKFLDLSKNEFSSTISSDISKLTNINIIQLNALALTGQVPVDAMKSLSTLEHIVITHATKMSGPLLEFSASWPNLTVFDIYQSGFTGTIPTTIGENTKLENLWLEGALVDSSDIPTEVGLLTNLKQLSIDSELNVMDGGTIPTELGNCQSMEVLQIFGDNFSGSIPTELGRLTNIMDLRVDGGMLTGSVPSEIGLLTKLTVLTLSENRLEGTLPSELENLHDLIFFEVNDNNLTGSIPSGVCKIQEISIDRDCIIECECCNDQCEKWASL